MDSIRLNTERGAVDDFSREEIVVRADEVDEAGADISTISPNGDDDFEVRVESRRQQDLQHVGGPKTLANAAPGAPKPPMRPILRREASAPPPPKQPPPPAPPQQQDETGNSPDSLTLAQLKDIVKDLPKLEPVAYAYTYEDTRTFPEELEEWFQYTEEDRDMLSRAEEAFEEELSNFDFGEDLPPSMSQHRWLELPLECRNMFMYKQFNTLGSLNAPLTTRKLEIIAYFAAGVYKETAWLKEGPLPEDEHDYEPPNDKYRKTVGQLRYIVEAAETICWLERLPTLYEIMRTIYEDDESVSEVSHRHLPRGLLTTSTELSETPIRYLYPRQRTTLHL